MDVGAIVTLAGIAVTAAAGLFGWAWKNLQDDRNYWRTRHKESETRNDALESELADEKSSHLTTKDDLLRQINELRTEVGTMRIEIASLRVQLGTTTGEST